MSITQRAPSKYKLEFPVTPLVMFEEHSDRFHRPQNIDIRARMKTLCLQATAEDQAEEIFREGIVSICLKFI